MKEANLLAGDCIINYRTVASFANEDLIVRDFDAMLDAPVKTATKKSHVMGLIFGFSQFVQYGVYAVMFYCASLFLQNFIDERIDARDPNIIKEIIEYSQSVFIAIFSMMMGAMSAGQNQQFGPDVGKARAAAGNIFSIMDLPSEINSLEEAQKKDKKEVNPKSFMGEIVFRNVWFRYPTRKSDWVLKGLNLKINKNETVALVGESGCGKSTIVSLILRFYDVNEGSILVDGVDVKDWNLASLRKTMGLVMQEPTLFNYTI